MDGSRIPYALVLLLCWIRVLGASVLPPTNVTFHCHNMQNTLHWSYEDLSEGLRFKVEVMSISSAPVTLWVDSPAMSMDLSNFSDTDNDCVVFVSAVKGSDESDPVPEEGIKFSYFQDSPDAKKCSVDLPEVNITTLKDNLLGFSFQHPGLFYPIGPKPRKNKSYDSKISLPIFQYHVEVINQNESHTFSCTESVCEGQLTVHGNQKSNCLNITGEMRKMSVQATKKYCSEPRTEGINPLAIILPIVVIVVVVGGALCIAFMVFIKKTRPKALNIKSLNFNKTGNNQAQNQAPTEYSALNMEPASPNSVTTMDQDTTTSSGPYRDEFRQPLGLGLPTAEPELEMEPEQVVAQGESEEGYTHGRCLDEDEEEEGPTPYEKRNIPLPNDNEA